MGLLSHSDDLDEGITHVILKDPEYVCAVFDSKGSLIGVINEAWAQRDREEFEINSWRIEKVKFNQLAFTFPKTSDLQFAFTNPTAVASPKNRVSVLEEALKFYAESENYYPPVGPSGRYLPAKVEADEGKVAREALDNES